MGTVAEGGGEKLKSAGSERNVLSCLLRSQEAWLSASNLVAEDWGHSINRALWQVIDSLYAEGVPISPVKISDRLPGEYSAEFERLGGWGYVELLTDLPLDPRTIEHEIKKLKALTVRRRARIAGDRIAQVAEEETDPIVVQEKSEIIVNEISGPVAEEAILLGSIGHDFLTKKIQQRGQLPGISCGWAELDNAISGFQPGRLYVVAGADKAGKSATLLNWAHHMAVHDNRPVLWISTEHEPEDDYQRLLAMESDVLLKSIELGSFANNEEQLDRIDRAEKRLAVAPLHFIAMPHFTLNKIHRAVWKYKRQHDIQAVYFDYLKLPEDNMAVKNSWAEAGALAYGLKNLAASQKLPVITACQINRMGIDAMRIGNEVDSGYFALSHDIGRALSVGLVIRDLSKKEKDQHGGFMETPKRIVRIDKNRHGPDTYKGLIKFEAEVMQMREERRIT